MASLLTPVQPKKTAGGAGGRGGDRVGDGSGGGSGPGPSPPSLQRYQTGMWLAIGAMVMVFAAFTSAYVVRKGASNDWRPIRLPSILWLTTAVLLTSSVSIERARRASLPHRWLTATWILGLLFLAGQYLAWRQLAASGVYLATNPSSSFFYLLTGFHGLHILGGLLALTYVVWRVWSQPAWQARQAAVDATALYWHFLDGLWIYLFFLLMVWR